jgi:hypothetical protein
MEDSKMMMHYLGLVIAPEHWMFLVVFFTDDLNLIHKWSSQKYAAC